MVNQVIPAADRGSVKGRARGIGIVLASHIDERLFAETEDKKYTLVLKKMRRRFEENRPSTRYHFHVATESELPEDPDSPQQSAAG